VLAKGLAGALPPALFGTAPGSLRRDCAQLWDRASSENGLGASCKEVASIAYDGHSTRTKSEAAVFLDPAGRRNAPIEKKKNIQELRSS